MSNLEKTAKALAVMTPRGSQVESILPQNATPALLQRAVVDAKGLQDLKDGEQVLCTGVLFGQDSVIDRETGEVIEKETMTLFLDDNSALSTVSPTAIQSVKTAIKVGGFSPEGMVLTLAHRKSAKKQTYYILLLEDKENF